MAQVCSSGCHSGLFAMQLSYSPSQSLHGPNSARSSIEATVMSGELPGHSCSDQHDRTIISQKPQARPSSDDPFMHWSKLRLQSSQVVAECSWETVLKSVYSPRMFQDPRHKCIKVQQDLSNSPWLLSLSIRDVNSGGIPGQLF